MPSEILIPEGIDLTKWSCVACDQHTKEPKYFESLEKIVGDAPSAYRVVFPEIFLGKEDEKRIENINATMKKYLESGILKPRFGYILTVRTTASEDRRVGIVTAVDLEDYSFVKGENSLIRATEETVLERIPTRVNIRKNAVLELPHVMLLLSDKKKCVIEKLDEEKEKFEKLYDFELNMGGGRIEGYFIPESVNVDEMIENTKSSDMLLAVGDGNHSLAAAKTVWENNKKQGKTDDPSRYALVEIVNVYSDAIDFKPIHRLLLGENSHKIIQRLEDELSGSGTLKIMCGSKEIMLNCPANTVECYKIVQQIIDDFVKAENCEVDYIHGDEVLAELSNKADNVGIMMPSLKKDELFEAVERFGALPRKTFSMGEADDKRFYLEARKII